MLSVHVPDCSPVCISEVDIHKSLYDIYKNNAILEIIIFISSLAPCIVLLIVNLGRGFLSKVCNVLFIV